MCSFQVRCFCCALSTCLSALSVLCWCFTSVAMLALLRALAVGARRDATSTASSNHEDYIQTMLKITYKQWTCCVLAKKRERGGSVKGECEELWRRAVSLSVAGWHYLFVGTLCGSALSRSLPSLTPLPSLPSLPPLSPLPPLTLSLSPSLPLSLSLALSLHSGWLPPSVDWQYLLVGILSCRSLLAAKACLLARSAFLLLLFLLILLLIFLFLFYCY